MVSAPYIQEYCAWLRMIHVPYLSNAYHIKPKKLPLNCILHDTCHSPWWHTWRCRQGSKGYCSTSCAVSNSINYPTLMIPIKGSLDEIIHARLNGWVLFIKKVDLRERAYQVADVFLVMIIRVFMKLSVVVFTSRRLDEASLQELRQVWRRCFV